MTQVTSDVGVKVGKGFDETGGVAGLEAVITRLACQIGIAGTPVENDAAAIGPAQPEIFRLHLQPFGTGLAAEYPNAQAVAVTESRLAVPALNPQFVLVTGEEGDVVDNVAELP